MPKTVIGLKPRTLSAQGFIVKPLYKPMDFVLVRAPLFPVEKYLSLPSNLRELEKIVSDDMVRTALTVGSVSLVDALERASGTGEEDQKVWGKALRYLIRMSTRPTPYGLFAGVSLAGWGSCTNLSISSDPRMTRARPDMAWLLDLAIKLESNQEIRPCLGVMANSALFARAGRVFVPERLSLGEGRQEPRVSVRHTQVVKRVLAAAREPIAYQELVRKILQTTTGATREKVEALLNELLDQTLLFSNLRPPLTIEEPARYLLDQLTEIPPARETREKLKSFLDDLTTWDSLSMEGSSIRYRELITSASQIHARQSENPVQVDSAFHLSGDSISCLVGAEVARAAELLVRLSPLPPGIPHLQAYREAFVARYGHEREVSLLELLDPHFGLGPPSKIASTHESTTGEKRQANRRNDVLLQIACEALRDCNPIVELDEETLKSLETWNPSPENAPVTLDMNAFVAAESPEAIDRGEFKVIVGPNIGASAAGRNLGRFAYLLGPEARRALNKAAQFEESRLSQAIWAEIVYLPRKLRSANVSIRPNAREYEIAYGVFPGGGADRILPLDELVVGVHDRRFYLRWPRKNAEVKIASGHMLNYADAPSICRFLSEVRLDSQPHLHAFDWGSASAFPFLPRIQVGRIVLCPARWRIDAGISKRWFLVKTPDLFQDAFRAWRKRWNVPRHVFLSAGDNRLLIDTENESQLAELKRDTHRLKDGYPLILEEVLPALHENWLVGPGGHYVSELVVSLSLDGKPVEDGHRLTKTLPLEENVSQIPSEMRLSPPGSSWLYLKLYAPQELEEDLLLQPLRPFLETVLDQGLAHDYFFVRYSDPNPHLRLRFRGEPQRLVASLLPELTTLGGKLMTQGLCTHFTFDTYDREIERYGGAEAIGPAESIFAADSRAVMGLFRVMRQEKLVGSAERMIVGVLSVSDFLNSLKLEDADMALWRRSQQSDRHEAGQEFREHKERLLAFLREPTCILGEDGAKDLTRLLADRRQALASFRDTLYRLKTEKKLTAPIHHICESLVHMHCNRLFGTDRALERKVTGMYLRVCEAVSSTY